MASPAQRGSDDADVIARLAQLAFLVQGTLARVAEAHQLTTVQARLLVVLSDREPTMQVLARIMGLEKSSLTGLVERAEARGLLERFAAEESRRSVRVRLTEEGHRRSAAYRDAARPELAGLLGSLSEAERRRLGTLADRIVQDYVVARDIDVSTIEMPSRFA
jgi:MarR family transcriptional regulator, lower aerobic nicotinate degradation pathway regulator